jgi:hypothetical protein
MGSAWKYLDNIVAAIAAIQAYMSHKQEARLAKALARTVYEAVEESIGPDKMGRVDKYELIEAVGAVVEALEPAFGLDNDDESDDPWL